MNLDDLIQRKFEPDDRGSFLMVLIEVDTFDVFSWKWEDFGVSDAILIQSQIVSSLSWSMILSFPNSFKVITLENKQ